MDRVPTHPRHLFLATIVAAAVAASALPAFGQVADTSEPIDQSALAALERMGAYLRTLNSFKVRAETSTDYVLEDGQKLQVSGSLDVVARRPDGLFAEVRTDENVRQFYYDGKSFTIFAPALGYYGTGTASGTLGELAESLERDHSIDLPLADLFLWGTDKSGAGEIKTAMVLEPAEIAGETCEHFAFQQADVDWQIWIRKGPSPLPCKLTIVSKDDEAQPQHSSVMTWTIDPTVSDATFKFKPPATATKIEISKVEADGGSQ